jgi:small subunit ribosomal protein S2
VREEVEAVGAPFFVERWIGGFLTNWDSIKKNIDKINTLAAEETAGAWKKFPKHEQVKLSRYLAKLRVYYGGVLQVKELPAAVFIIDVKKEISALREAKIVGAPVIAIVDTNSDPTLVDYVIPANDDAVGSIQLITHVIAQAYKEGKAEAQKGAEVAKQPEKKVEEAKPSATIKEVSKAPEEPKKRKGRSKKAETVKPS